MISVIVPAKTLTDYLIKENLPALDKQTYKPFEAIILPDEKSGLDRELQGKYSWLKIIPTGKITRPAEKRDIGVKNARGKIIAFIDDDAYPAPVWLEKAMDLFDKNQVAAVCGPGILPAKTNLTEKICDAVFKSRLGSGGYSYRFAPKKERYVDDYPSMNFLIKKDVFDKLGGFNNNYWPGEDSKLCEDLVYKEKGKILYHPDLVVYHHRRNDFFAYLKQHGNYGYHRGAFFAHGDKNSRRLSYLIPSIFVLYLIFLILISLFLPLIAQLLNYFIIPLLIYWIGTVFLFFSSFFATHSLLISLLAPPVLILTHLVYGLMFVKGYFIGIIKKEKIYE